MGDSLDSPPRGWYSIGNWRISRPCLAARITISEANSIPVDCRSRRPSAAAAQRAHAAVGVAHAGAVEEVEEPAQHGVADVAVEERHRPGPMLSIRLPITRSAPVSNSARKRGISSKSYVRSASAITITSPARGRESRQVGAAVAAAGLLDDTRAGGAGEVAAAVGRAVVDDDHLALDAVLGEHELRLGDALPRCSRPRSGTGSRPRRSAPADFRAPFAALRAGRRRPPSPCSRHSTVPGGAAMGRVRV